MEGQWSFQAPFGTLKPTVHLHGAAVLQRGAFGTLQLPAQSSFAVSGAVVSSRRPAPVPSPPNACSAGSRVGTAPLLAQPTPRTEATGGRVTPVPLTRLRRGRS